MEQVTVTRIRSEDKDLYDRSSKKNIYMDLLLEKIPALAEVR